MKTSRYFTTARSGSCWQHWTEAQNFRDAVPTTPVSPDGSNISATDRGRRRYATMAMARTTYLFGSACLAA